MSIWRGFPLLTPFIFLQAAKGEQNNDPNVAPVARKRHKSAAARVDLHDLTLLGECRVPYSTQLLLFLPS